MPGSNNDINVLDISPLFVNLANGVAHPANYIILGKNYNMGYYLADSIYIRSSLLLCKLFMNHVV